MASTKILLFLALAILSVRPFLGPERVRRGMNPSARLLADTRLLAAGSFNYHKTGSDWVAGQCKTNNWQQSPIDLVIDATTKSTSKVLTGGKVYPKDASIQVTQENTGGTIKLTPVEGEHKFLKATLKDIHGNSKNYEAVQLHFHAPSEHTVNGRFFDLEMHIVMANKDAAVGGRIYGVLGFFFVEEGEYGATRDIPFFTSIVDNFAKTSKQKVKHSINMKEFFQYVPKDNNFYHYEGGLTTPTCDEKVNWYNNRNVILINKKQLKKFTDLWVSDTVFNGDKSVTNDENNGVKVMMGNNRVVQQLNKVLGTAGARKIHLGGNYEVCYETSSSPDWTDWKLIVIFAMISICIVTVVWIKSQKDLNDFHIKLEQEESQREDGAEENQSGQAQLGAKSHGVQKAPNSKVIVRGQANGGDGNHGQESGKVTMGTGNRV